MRKLFIILVLSIVPFILAAQEDQQDLVEKETLEDNGFIKGGFASAGLKSTKIVGQNVAMLGGYGGKLLNNNIFIGGGGYGLAHGTAIEIDNQLRSLQFAYGGLIVEYIGIPENLLHFSVNMLFGGGVMGYENYDFNNISFVSEICINAEINVSDHVHIAIGGGYRYVNGVKFESLNNKRFSGTLLNLQLKLGGI